MMVRNSSKAWILFLMMLVVAGVTVLLLYLQLRSDKISELSDREGQFSFLLVLHNQGEHIQTQYVIMNTDNGKMGFMDVPGHTGALIDETNKVDRIDSIFEVDSPGKYRRNVEKLLNRKADFLFIINTEQLARSVNLLSGVELFIANPIEDLSGEKMILLPSGSVLLDGDKSVDYLSFEKEGEPEVDRVGRRQKFFQAYFQKMVSHREYLVHPEVFPVFYRLWDSSLDKRSFQEWLRRLNTMDVDNIVQQRVLGVLRVVDGKELLFPHYDSRLLKETVGKLADSLANAKIVADEEFKITVEILNGTKQNGLAGRTAQIFQSFGVDVSSINNADTNDYSNTIILDHRGNPEGAQRIARIIQCDRIRRPPSEGVESIFDFTIILGRDFDGRYVKQEGN